MWEGWARWVRPQLGGRAGGWDPSWGEGQVGGTPVGGKGRWVGPQLGGWARWVGYQQGAVMSTRQTSVSGGDTGFLPMLTTGTQCSGP